MGKRWFPIWDGENHVHVPVKKIVFLKADRNYTDVHYFDPKAKKANEPKRESHLLSDEKSVVHPKKKTIKAELSGCLSKYESKLPDIFCRMRRDLLVNVNHVATHAYRKVTLSSGHHFSIPKKKWKQVKEALNPQLRFPFP